MGRGRATDSESRFLRYVEGLVSVIGHADRARPLRDYCLGLMVSRGRKSVEPMAATTAPDRTSAQHQSLLHFVGAANWSDENVLAKVREMVLPEITNTADNSASKRTAKSRYHCRSLTTTPACRWRTSFICPKAGLKIARDGARPECPKRSAFRPSLRSRLLKSVGPARRGSPAATCCSTLATVTIPSYARAFPRRG
jgi:hypothetical protein